MKSPAPPVGLWAEKPASVATLMSTRKLCPWFPFTSAGKLGTSRIQTLGQDPQVTAFRCPCLTGPSWAESSQGPAHTLSSSGHADGRNGKQSTGASLRSCRTSMHTAPAPHSQGHLTHLSPISPSMPFQDREALKLYCILIASHVTLSQIHG